MDTTWLDGGCACGALRYRFHREPMFVHCCRCTRCQRETGGPFAHHAMIEFTQMSLLQGEDEFISVPTDSGGKHRVACCVSCRTAVRNEHGSRQAVKHCVRVGTLDQPSRCPPLAHIFVRSKQAWLTLPPESLARWAAAGEIKKLERVRKLKKAKPAGK